MPLSKRINAIDTKFTRSKPQIYDAESPVDAYVNPYELNLFEGEDFSINVREVMVEGSPPPNIIVMPADRASEGVAIIQGDVVSGTVPQISVFGRNRITLTVEAEN